MCCWTFLGTQSMISSQRLGQNLLDLRGKMRLTMLTVIDEPPSEATTGIIQFGANFPSGKKMNHRPATARFLPWLCVPLWLCCGLCTTVYQSVPLCTTLVVQWLCVPLWVVVRCCVLSLWWLWVVHNHCHLMSV